MQANSYFAYALAATGSCTVMYSLHRVQADIQIHGIMCSWVATHKGSCCDAKRHRLVLFSDFFTLRCWPFRLNAACAMQWGEEGVDIKDKHYRLVRLHFVDKCTPQTDSPSASLEGMGDTANALLNGTM